MRPEAAIALNLLDRFGQLVIGSPALDLVMPLEKYSPTAHRKYLEAQHLPNATDTFTIASGLHNHQGFLQVNCYGGVTEGIIPLNEVAGEVIDFFKQGTILAGNGVNVKIIRQPYTSPALKDGSWLLLPVSIPYICSA